mmetsp:Transcript_7849/g.16390  ORF Transcript_7849/g.16390 Transcript_7849/m.16390 type:complete len:216 (+) Transcript_7849:623-1270(+)
MVLRLPLLFLLLTMMMMIGVGLRIGTVPTRWGASCSSLGRICRRMRDMCRCRCCRCRCRCRHRRILLPPSRRKQIGRGSGGLCWTTTAARLVSVAKVASASSPGVVVISLLFCQFFFFSETFLLLLFSFLFSLSLSLCRNSYNRMYLNVHVPSPVLFLFHNIWVCRPFVSDILLCISSTSKWSEGAKLQICTAIKEGVADTDDDSTQCWPTTAQC